MLIEWAKKQNLPKKQMKKIENLCLRAINLFSHQVEYRPALGLNMEPVISVFNFLDKELQVKLPQYLIKDLEIFCKEQNISPEKMASPSTRIRIGDPTN